jgi:SIR2-like domain
VKLDQFPFDQVATWLKEGDVVPFLGAGASIAGLEDGEAPPNGHGLADELRTRMPAYPGSETDVLPKVAQFFELSVFDRVALYAFVQQRFARPARAALAAVPEMLADVPIGEKTLYMVTTNYDDQVEAAFEHVDRPLCVITQEVHHPQFGAAKVWVQRPGGEPELQLAKKLVLAERLPPGTAILYKMHGSLAAPQGPQRDSLIITEDDYVDFLTHAGGTKTAALVPPPPLTTAFRGRRFLFLGYSLEDWNLRVLLRLLAIRNTAIGGSDLRSWSIQLDPQEVEEALWFQRKVSLYSADLVEFCGSLRSAWQKGGA